MQRSPRNILASNFCVTSGIANTTLYGDTAPKRTESVTAKEDPQRKRVTGGILLISFAKDIT